MSDGLCPQCGRPLEEHQREVQFRLPDPVLDLPDRERTSGVWLSHDDPVTAVMMQVPDLGAFVRVLLPVRLTGGYSVRFGVWLAIDPMRLRHVFDVWWEPTYADLVLDGYLANRLPVFDLLGSEARATVIDPDTKPVVTSSTDEVLQRVLTRAWPHDDILPALPGV